MVEPQLPPPKANTFIQQVSGKTVPARGPSVSNANGSGKGFQRIIGILDEVTQEGRRKIYTSSSLDEGVEIWEDDIRNFRRLPKSQCHVG